MTHLIALDFDGVIHQYVSKWVDATVIPDPPMPGAFEFIIRMMNAGHEIAIISSRNRSLQGQDAMSKWMLQHGFPAHKLADIQWPTYKPPAFLTIDDRAMRFTGRWPSLSDIHSFRPWKISIPESKDTTTNSDVP